MRRLICLFPLLLCAAIPAFAGPITYDIFFTSANGLSPAAGSFVFDSNPQNASPFSNFVVVWDTLGFDFTAAANSLGPGAFFGACSVPASGAGCGEASGTWSEGDLWIGAVSDWAHAQHSFTLDICNGGSCQSVESVSSVFAPQVTGQGTGDFQVVVHLEATPEPATLGMMLLAALAGAGIHRMRSLHRRTASPAAPQP